MIFLKNLFSEINIGSMVIKNRLLMPAMSINFGIDKDDNITDQLTQYFVTRAKGGVGMMLVGGGAVHPLGLEVPDLPKLWKDSCIPSLQKMVNEVKKYDVKFGMQIMHGGRQSSFENRIAPSAIPAPAVVKGPPPKEMNINDIKEAISSFGDAARRSKEAGFDFIEIHGAHGYLVSQFLAKNSNTRQDNYGGDFQNRVRFILEVLKDIKEKTGSNFPVGIRINGNDYIDNGFTLDESIELAKILEKAGAAYLHVSAGVYGSKELTIPSMYVKHGCFVHLAEAVKKEVSIPVITVGRIKSPEMADQIIKLGKADMVAIGRSLIADPEYPNKAKQGKISEIRPCIGCCLGCIHSVLQKEPGSCVVNPDVGREYLIKDNDKTDSSKKVLIIGAGPAGLAAARMAAIRGHNVIICDEQSHIGGMAKYASIPPGRSEIMDIINYFINELKRLKVELRLNTSINENLVDSINPQEVIIASGSLPELPVIKGLFQTKMELLTVIDILSGNKITGDKVIIIGGGQAALVLTDFLAQKGKQIVVLNRKNHFAEEMSSNDRFYLRQRLKNDNVNLIKQVSIQKFSDDNVVIKSKGEKKVLEGFDTVVIAEKMTPIIKIKELFKNKKMSVNVIGDAKNPRIIMYAISEAEEMARNI